MSKKPVGIVIVSHIPEIAAGLASHASVSRLLYVMGRNSVLPKRW
ncbi:hypothetical protein P9210_06420 [Heyndrickxia coagulans]|nr:hypothetical protein [Heyndrickxia coagulans]